MNNQKLSEIIEEVSTEVQGQQGHWRFLINKTTFICLTDEFHNRMRIIAPIKEEGKVTTEELQRCLSANFHTALDARYALSDGIMWAAFIHPLNELTPQQVTSAIAQVYSCVHTYGTQYSGCLLYTSPSPRDQRGSRMPSSA